MKYDTIREILVAKTYTCPGMTIKYRSIVMGVGWARNYICNEEAGVGSAIRNPVPT